MRVSTWMTQKKSCCVIFSRSWLKKKNLENVIKKKKILILSEIRLLDWLVFLELTFVHKNNISYSQIQHYYIYKKVFSSSFLVFSPNLNVKVFNPQPPGPPLLAVLVALLGLAAAHVKDQIQGGTHLSNTSTLSQSHTLTLSYSHTVLWGIKGSSGWSHIQTFLNEHTVNIYSGFFVCLFSLSDVFFIPMTIPCFQHNPLSTPRTSWIPRGPAAAG